LNDAKEMRVSGRKVSSASALACRCERDGTQDERRRCERRAWGATK
jgi:hypothetical protein